MELLSNLSWAALILALFGWWLAHPRSEREGSLLPGKSTQLAALLILSAILLPVISLTDDLQAAHNPAEVSTVARNERHFSPNAPLHLLPIAPGLPVFGLRSLHLRRVAFLAMETAAPVWDQRAGAALWSRPPPAV